jgi:hypothetical protein
LRVFENRVQRRRIFGSKRKQIKRGCRKFHNEEINNLHSSPIVIRVINQLGLERRDM